MLLEATSDAPARKTPQEAAAEAAAELAAAVGESSTAYADSFIALDSEEGAESESLAAASRASAAPAAPDTTRAAAAGGGDGAESLAAESVGNESISNYAGRAPPWRCCALLHPGSECLFR